MQRHIPALTKRIVSVYFAAGLLGCESHYANHFTGTWRTQVADGLGNTYTKECRFLTYKLSCSDNRRINHDETRYDASYKVTSETDADPDRSGLHFTLLPDQKLKVTATGPDGGNYDGLYTRVGGVDVAPMPRETYGHPPKATPI